MLHNNQIQGTPVFPPGQANLKQSPGENPGVGSIPLQSIVTSNKPKSCWTVDGTGSKSRSESAGANSTVGGCLYPVNRTQTDDPINGEEWARWGQINRRQVLVNRCLAMRQILPRKFFEKYRNSGNILIFKIYIIWISVYSKTDFFF